MAKIITPPPTTMVCNHCQRPILNSAYQTFGAQNFHSSCFFSELSKQEKHVLHFKKKIAFVTTDLDRGCNNFSGSPTNICDTLRVEDASAVLPPPQTLQENEVASKFLNDFYKYGNTTKWFFGDAEEFHQELTFTVPKEYYSRDGKNDEKRQALDRFLLIIDYLSSYYLRLHTLFLLTQIAEESFNLTDEQKTRIALHLTRRTDATLFFLSWIRNEVNLQIALPSRIIPNEYIYNKQTIKVTKVWSQIAERMEKTLPLIQAIAPQLTAYIEASKKRTTAQKAIFRAIKETFLGLKDAAEGLPFCFPPLPVYINVENNKPQLLYDIFREHYLLEVTDFLGIAPGKVIAPIDGDKLGTLTKGGQAGIDMMTISNVEEVSFKIVLTNRLEEKCKAFAHFYSCQRPENSNSMARGFYDFFVNADHLALLVFNKDGQLGCREMVKRFYDKDNKPLFYRSIRGYTFGSFAAVARSFSRRIIDAVCLEFIKRSGGGGYIMSSENLSSFRQEWKLTDAMYNTDQTVLKKKYPKLYNDKFYFSRPRPTYGFVQYYNEFGRSDGSANNSNNWIINAAKLDWCDNIIDILLHDDDSNLRIVEAIEMPEKLAQLIIK